MKFFMDILLNIPIYLYCFPYSLEKLGIIVQHSKIKCMTTVKQSLSFPKIAFKIVFRKIMFYVQSPLLSYFRYFYQLVETIFFLFYEIGSDYVQYSLLQMPLFEK